jgi:hypothetical protein
MARQHPIHVKYQPNQNPRRHFRTAPKCAAHKESEKWFRHDVRRGEEKKVAEINKNKKKLRAHRGFMGCSAGKARSISDKGRPPQGSATKSSDLSLFTSSLGSSSYDFMLASARLVYIKTLCLSVSFSSSFHPK